VSDGNIDDVDRFESALREWGKKPPRTPAEHAATRVLASLPRHGTRTGWRRFAWAGAALVLLALVLWLTPARRAPQVASASVVAAPLDENVVLWWLDDETPVYFVIGPADESKEGTS